MAGDLDALTRALTAQAWATACALSRESPWHGDDKMPNWYHINKGEAEHHAVAALPTPEALAIELLSFGPQVCP